MPTTDISVDTSSIDTARKTYLRRVNNPWLMRLYFLRKLPTLLWWGVRVERVTLDEGQTSLPFGKRTQNPFASTYFAAQAGTAELSTGVLAITHLQGQPPVSMLVTELTGTYTKKAAGRITFTCQDGPAFAKAVAHTVATGEPVTVSALSIGTLEDGTEVSRHTITWSLKKRRRK